MLNESFQKQKLKLKLSIELYPIDGETQVIVSAKEANRNPIFKTISSNCSNAEFCAHIQNIITEANYAEKIQVTEKKSTEKDQKVTNPKAEKTKEDTNQQLSLLGG